jgi:hypothetical protein
VNGLWEQGIVTKGSKSFQKQIRMGVVCGTSLKKKYRRNTIFNLKKLKPTEFTIPVKSLDRFSKPKFKKVGSNEWRERVSFK